MSMFIHRVTAYRAVTTIEDTEVMSSVFFLSEKKKEGENCRQIVGGLKHILSTFSHKFI